MSISFIAMSKSEVENFRSGGLDANNQSVQRTTSDGDGNPCRYCMKDIPAGKGMLMLSYRPFQHKHPYAETGPILLCEEACEPFGQSEKTPDAVATRRDFILRGYSKDEVIVGGTGKITAIEDVRSYAESLFSTPEVTSVHIRSSSNNCFFCKIENSQA